MIESIYLSKSLLFEISSSPYQKYVDEFVRFSFDSGYRPDAIRVKLGFILKFLRWSAYNSIGPSKLKKKNINKFYASLPKYKKCPIVNGAARGFLEFLRFVERDHNKSLFDRPLQRFYKTPKILATVSSFQRYMEDEKGLTPSSVVRFKTLVGQFLTYVFPKDNYDPKKIKSSDFLEFIRLRGKKYCDRTLRADGSALKCFTRYLYGKKLTQSDLSYAIPAISIWKNQNVIHTLTEDQMKSLLASCNRDEPTGVRDYAILLLLIRYGLRPLEIIDLRFEDLLWNEKKMIVRGKGRKSANLPLESDVEIALKRYIEHARPNSSAKTIFIRAKAPFVSFSKSGAISSVVRHALGRCGFSPEVSGARLLRYSVASAILNKGGSLQEVSELLRHTSIDTSVRYTRLDMTRLKLVPLAWPSEGSNK